MRSVGRNVVDRRGIRTWQMRIRSEPRRAQALNEDGRKGEGAGLLLRWWRAVSASKPDDEQELDLPVHAARKIARNGPWIGARREPCGGSYEGLGRPPAARRRH